MKKRNAIFDGEQMDVSGRMHVCPKTGRKRFRQWMFPLMGIVSFIWFLVRVLPKPSRAAYPCQRVAAPLAASFVMWIAGLFGTAFAYRRWRIAILQHRRLVPVLCAVAALTAGIVTVTNLPHPARAGYPSFHDPIGVAQGIHPGRVVWVHNPEATNWAGYSPLDNSDHWYDDAHTDPLVVERMFSQSIRGVAGASSDAAAWDAIFRYFNQKQGRGDRGYYSGEKIMIKTNFVTCNWQMFSPNGVDLSTWDKRAASKNCIDTSPQMIRALLKQLVSVGVSQSNITVGDSTAYWPNCYLDQIRAQYPDVNYLQCVTDPSVPTGPNRVAAEWDTTAAGLFNWSTTAADLKLQDKLPTAYTQADYLINFTVLKGHSSGITLCGKNDYGSLIRLPNGRMPYLEPPAVPPPTPDYYLLHDSLPNANWSPGVGKYRAIVDMMGHPGLGGKTLLYLIDGLYGGYYSNAKPVIWNSAPFNGDWPSSIFASQDPVAIDSVGYDFLNKEWPNIVSGGNTSTAFIGSLQGGAEDFLHEAALANAPPSGTFYDPDRDGFAMQSLGVHEHWNNSISKQYSRNLGLASGIELLSLTSASRQLTAIGGSGTDCKWYTGSCGGTLVSTGSSIFVNPTATTTYYARWENTCGVSNCATTTVTGNTITGTVSMGYTGTSRVVTFVLNGGTTMTASVNNGGAYMLTNVIDAVTAVSAKTEWTLRKKLTGLIGANGQIVANFTVDNMLLGGDLNGTNSINVNDYSIFKANFSLSNLAADINGDGVVTIDDYTIMKTNWFNVGDVP